jgi:hypothetical protein
LRGAGFAQVEIATREEKSTAANAREPAIAYCQGTPLRNEIEARDAGRLEAATQAASDAVAARFGGGAIEGPMRALVITAQA